MAYKINYSFWCYIGAIKKIKTLKSLISSVFLNNLLYSHSTVAGGLLVIS